MNRIELECALVLPLGGLLFEAINSLKDEPHKFPPIIGDYMNERMLIGFAPYMFQEMPAPLRIDVNALQTTCYCNGHSTRIFGESSPQQTALAIIRTWLQWKFQTREI